jgi:hypothetical protein
MSYLRTVLRIVLILDGLIFLAAAATGRVAVAWGAFVLSVLGIAFGLSSRRVVGEARDIHVVLVPLAVAVLALLLVGMRRGPAVFVPKRSSSTER